MNQPDFKIKEMNYSGVSQFYRSTPSRAYVVEAGLSSCIRGDLLFSWAHHCIIRKEIS